MFWCDEEECDIDETCPVCTAYREFTATFEEGTSVDLVLVKFEPILRRLTVTSLPPTVGANLTIGISDHMT